MANHVYKIPEAVNHPQFLKFLDYYAKRFIKAGGYGRWLKEYQDMLEKGFFSPRILKAFYIQILNNTFKLDFQREQAIWEIACYAVDATEAYVNKRENALYNIYIITGELAYDDDDDPYTNLTYEEAKQIVEALNEEAEEELFIMKQI